MKRYLLLLVVFLIPLFVFPQKRPESVDILLGKEVRNRRSTAFQEIIGFDNSGYYMLKMERYKYFIESYSNDLLQGKSALLDMRQGKKLRNFEFAIHFNNNLYVFSSFHDKNLKKNFLYVQTFDKKNFKLLPDSRQVAEIDYKSKWNDGDFSYEFSRDKSKLLIMYKLPYDKGEHEKFGFHLFDNNLNELWTKNIDLPYNDELFEVEKYRVDEKGNIFVLGLVYQGKAKKIRQGLPNYEYHILAYTNKGEQMKEYAVNLKNRFITDMQISIASNGNIVCAGFYSDNGTVSIKGTFFQVLNIESKEMLSESVKDFDVQFLAEFMNDRKAAKGNELYQYDLDKLILRGDGGAILVAEQYYVDKITRTIPTAYGMYRSVTTYYYNYNDIIVVNINPDGSIYWTKKIPKRQVTIDDNGYYSSYAMGLANGQLHFVFNDHPNNLNPENRRIDNFNKGRYSVVVLVSLDGEGNMTKEALFTARETEMMARPKVSKQMSPKELIVYGVKGNYQRFVKLAFKDYSY